jgi:multidrug resistance efflux pump
VAAVTAAGVVATWEGAAVSETTTATVERGALSATLTATGTLRPLRSSTYRSPLAGRETEITFLAPEGTHVGAGDLIVRLDAVALERDLERAVQEVRQAEVELQVAEIEAQEAKAAIDSLSQGEAALAVEETRTRLGLAEKRVERLREEHETLRPLMEGGVITREELRKTSDQLEQAEEELALTRRRAEILIKQTRPRDQQRAELQLAQREAQRENVRTRLAEARARALLLNEQFENSNLYARHPGMVVYEEYLNANPRRKIRVGDRVTESQGIVTIPELNQMFVEASVGEADLQRVHPGQPATIVLEAYRDSRLTGKVTRVGTLARRSSERPFEGKRFDLIVALDPTDIELRPEMTARVDVLLGNKEDVLLIPVTAVFERQGLPVVHVRKAIGTETRGVRLGQSSDTLVEVVEGLAEGERVALTDVGGRAPETPTAAPERRIIGGFGQATGPIVPQ